MKIKTVDAAKTSLLLSQSGEFGFVIFGLAVTSGVLQSELFHILTLIVAITMVATPFMVNLGDYIDRRVTIGDDDRHDVSTDHLNSSETHAIIAGFGRVGQRIAKIFQAANLPYVAIESNADRVIEGRKAGYPVFYGNANRVDVLKAAGAGDASVLVCTLDQTASALRLVRILKQHYPDVSIYARGRDRQHCNQLLEAGASMAISETLEASLQMSRQTLKAMNIYDDKTAEIIHSFREAYYK